MVYLKEEAVFRLVVVEEEVVNGKEDPQASHMYHMTPRKWYVRCATTKVSICMWPAVSFTVAYWKRSKNISREC